MREDQTACFVSLSFAGLVVLARSLNPIPSRTRPLNSSAPMVLWLKPWESRSLPGLPRTKQFLFTCHDQTNAASLGRRRFFVPIFIFWGSPAARFSAMIGGQHGPDYRFGLLAPVHVPVHDLFISKFVRSPALKSEPPL